jgi:hypothetical protein
MLNFPALPEETLNTSPCFISGMMGTGVKQSTFSNLAGQFCHTKNPKFQAGLEPTAMRCKRFQVHNPDHRILDVPIIRFTNNNNTSYCTGRRSPTPVAITTGSSEVSISHIVACITGIHCCTVICGA